MLNRRNVPAALALLGAAGAAAIGRPTPASAQNLNPTASSMERILTTKKLRVAAVASEEPYFHKDLSTGKWSGFCIAMASDIAEQMGVELEILESTWGNSILDLQANKIDLSFGLNPTPKRALIVDFPQPLFFNTSSFVGRKGFRAETWDDLNKPEVKIAVDIGSSRETIVRRFASKATIIGFKTSNDGLLAVLTGRADCFVCTVFLGLAARKANPNLGDFFMPKPLVQVTTTAALQYDRDGRFRQFFNAWVDFNRRNGQVRAWISDALADIGIKAEDMPPEVQF